MGILTNSAVSLTDEKRLKALLLGAVLERTIDHSGIDRTAESAAKRASGLPATDSSVTSLLGSRPLRLSN